MAGPRARPAREAVLQRKVLAWLHARGVPHLKVHGSRFQPAGWPDVLAWYHGQAFAIELKAVGGVPTPLQMRRLAQLADAGVRVLVTDSMADFTAWATQHGLPLLPIAAALRDPSA